MVLSETFSVIIILTSKGVIYSNAKRYTALKSLWLLPFLGGQAGFSPGQALQLLPSADSVYNKGSQLLLVGCFLTGVSLEWKREAPRTPLLWHAVLLGLQTSFWADVTYHILIYQCFQLLRNHRGQSESWKWLKAWIFPQGFNNLKFLRKILRD